MATGSQTARVGSGHGQTGGGTTDLREKTSGTASEELMEKAVEVKDGLRDMASIATEAGREQLDHLKEMAAESYEEGVDYVQQWQHNLERSIRKQPLTSLLIAAGIGALLGVCWRKL